MTSASWRWTWSGTAPAQTRRAASSDHAAASSCGAAIAAAGGQISPATTLGGRSPCLVREGWGLGAGAARETAGGGEEGEHGRVGNLGRVESLGLAHQSGRRDGEPESFSFPRFARTPLLKANQITRAYKKMEGSVFFIKLYGTIQTFIIFFSPRPPKNYSHRVYAGETRRQHGGEAPAA